MTWGEEVDGVDHDLREGVVAMAFRDLGLVVALFLVALALGCVFWLIAKVAGVLTLAVLVVGSLGFALALPGWIDE